MAADFFIRGDTKLDTKGFENAVGKLKQASQKGFSVIVKMGTDSADALENVSTNAKKANETLKLTQSTCSKVSSGFSKVADNSKKSSEEIGKNSQETRENTKNQKENSEKTKENSKTKEENSKKTKEHSEKTKENTEQLKKWGEAVEKLGGVAKKGFGVIASATAAATAALGTAGIASVKLASDLTEVQNVVDVTFGNSATEIDKWSKNAANAFGLSELQAKQFNGTMGAMLKSMGLTDSAILEMSTSMVGLAGDFASFYNLDVETAFQKIRSGISGETEPLKELGINMSVANLEAFALSQGLNKTYDSMTQAEQATLRYNYLMSTTSDAQGDFARTSDSLANQLRIASLQVQDLGGSIGAFLLPMANQGLQAINEMLTGLKEGFESGGIGGLIDSFQIIIVKTLEGIANAAPDFVQTAVELIGSFANGIVQALPQLVPAAGQILQTLVTGIIQLAPTVFSALQQLGSMILSAIQAILPNVTAGVSSFLETMLPQLLSFTEGLRERVGELVDIGLQLIQNLWNGIVQALPALIENIPQIITNIAGIINDNFPKILATGISMIWELIKGILGAIPDIIAALPKIIEAIVSVFTSFNWLSLGSNIITMLKNGITAMKGAVSEAAKNIFETVKGIIANLPETLKNIGSSGISFMANAIKGMLSAVVNAAKSIFNGIVGAVTSLPSKLFEIAKNAISKIWDSFISMDWGSLGGNVINGIIGGIGGALGGLVDAAVNAAKSAFDAAKNFLGIHSPSRLFRDQIGKMIPQGMAVGIETDTDKAVKSVQFSAQEILNKAKAALMSNNIPANSFAPVGSFSQMVQVSAALQTEHTTIVEMDGRTVGKVIAPFVDEFLF